MIAYYIKRTILVEITKLIKIIYNYVRLDLVRFLIIRVLRKLNASVIFVFHEG